MRELNLNAPLVRCRCGKYYSPNREAAIKLCKHVEEHKQEHNPVRFYECQFRGWHWTRQLHDIVRCVSCNGAFRPTDKRPSQRTCDTCEDLHEQRRAAKRAAKREAQELRILEQIAADRARIIEETRPSPAALARLRKDPTP